MSSWSHYELKEKKTTETLEGTCVLEFVSSMISVLWRLCNLNILSLRKRWFFVSYLTEDIVFVILSRISDLMYWEVDQRFDWRTPRRRISRRRLSFHWSARVSLHLLLISRFKNLRILDVRILRATTVCTLSKKFVSKYRSSLNRLRDRSILQRHIVYIPMHLLHRGWKFIALDGIFKISRQNSVLFE